MNNPVHLYKLLLNNGMASVKFKYFVSDFKDRHGGIVTQCQGFESWPGQDVSCFPKLKTGSEAHTHSYPIYAERWWGDRCVKLTTHFHLVSKLRTSAAIPLLPLISRRTQRQFHLLLPRR